MESMLLKYIEKKQKFQFLGLHRYQEIQKKTLSKYISIVLKRFPLTSKKILNSLETNS